MEPIESLRVLRVASADLARLEEFVREDARQAAPGDDAAPDAFAAGLRESLAAFDFLSSASHWLLAAEAEGRFAGYLSAARIAKLDARKAVLFVDELMVLPAYRRRGVARALWREAEALAREIGAWRIRLLVEEGNAAARGFYRAVGMEEHAMILCQRGRE